MGPEGGGFCGSPAAPNGPWAVGGAAGERGEEAGVASLKALKLEDENKQIWSKVKVNYYFIFVEFYKNAE